MDDLKPKLIKELVRFGEGNWRSSRERLQSLGMNTPWIQVALLRPLAEGPILELGLTENGRWVASAADGSVIDMEATGNYPLFLLLEFSYDKAQEVLLNEFSTRGLNEDWLAVFPFERLVVAALTSVSLAN